MITNTRARVPHAHVALMRLALTHSSHARALIARTQSPPSPRPLIFSQWTSVLDVMEWFLHERGLTFYRLDGSTNVSGAAARAAGTRA